MPEPERSLSRTIGRRRVYGEMPGAASRLRISRARASFVREESHEYHQGECATTPVSVVTVMHNVKADPAIWGGDQREIKQQMYKFSTKHHRPKVATAKTPSCCSSYRRISTPQPDHAEWSISRVQDKDITHAALLCISTTSLAHPRRDTGQTSDRAAA